MSWSTQISWNSSAKHNSKTTNDQSLRIVSSEIRKSGRSDLDWSFCTGKTTCLHSFPSGNTEELTCIAVITDYLHSSKLWYFYIIFNTCPTFPVLCEDVGGRVQVILIQSCNLDPNANLVTIFIERALLTFNITGDVGWAKGWWRTELAL